jgi:hypothetical protein
VYLDEVKAETKRLSNWAHMATVGADGYPDVVPVWPAWQDDTLWIFTATNSVKVRNIASDPNVALHWQVDESGDGIEVWGDGNGEHRLAHQAPTVDGRVHLQPRRLRSRWHRIAWGPGVADPSRGAWRRPLQVRLRAACARSVDVRTRRRPVNERRGADRCVVSATGTTPFVAAFCAH